MAAKSWGVLTNSEIEMIINASLPKVNSTFDHSPTGGQLLIQSDSNLTRAAQGPGSEALELAIKKVDSIDVKDFRGFTALMAAVVHENVEGVKFLIASGADLRVEFEGSGWTALTLALTKKIEILSELIDADSSPEHIDHADADGYTALMWALRFHAWPQASMLKEAGADVSKISNQGQSILLYSVETGDVSLMNWLMEQKGWFSRAQVENVIDQLKGKIKQLDDEGTQMDDKIKSRIRSRSEHYANCLKYILEEYPQDFIVDSSKNAMPQKISNPAPSISGHAMHEAMTLFVANNPGPSSAENTAARNPDGSTAKKTFSPRRQTGAPAEIAPAGATRRPAPSVPEDEIRRPVNAQNATVTTRMGNPGYQEVQLPSP
ncbi:ankyrin repeat domain-containing protein [Acidovorax sp. CCYZU-2555]|uniref:ankyrin repeat domain-containing protein n=1 Tax=Acidovorax sp. CCYZU-2555 TaxID=2835042 RepID=UPI001BCEAF4F|nr:ankyrin repeat domain-containing protein [Acidovorax sp. CCYZU-2555]MBS7778558.1 ankyrin repeat domain-containing protein [Acidovorax sp. CCYZU-2555]